jgi:hypothetical protein
MTCPIIEVDIELEIKESWSNLSIDEEHLVILKVLDEVSGSSRIIPNISIGVIINNRWLDIVQNWRVESVIDDSAFICVPTL